MLKSGIMISRKIKIPFNSRIQDYLDVRGYIISRINNSNVCPNLMVNS